MHSTVKLVFPNSIRKVHLSGDDGKVRETAAKVAEACGALSYSITKGVN